MFEGIERYVLSRQDQKIIIQRMLHHCDLSLSLPDTGRSSGISAPHVLQHSCLRCKLTRDRQTDRQFLQSVETIRIETVQSVWLRFG